MFPFEKRFLVIGEPIFDDPTTTYPSFGKELEAIAEKQGILWGETGLYPPRMFPDFDQPHFEYRLFKGKTASSEYEPIQFDYLPTESTLRVYSNIPESKAMPIVEFIANCYLGILLEENGNTISEIIVQCRCMTPSIKRFKMIANMLSEAITDWLGKSDCDIQNKYWMKAGLELLSQRPKSPDKAQNGPMRIGFNYHDSVCIAIAARKLYEALYAWISECHPEQFDTYHRDYNSLAGQALDIFENLSSEEDWVYCLFTLNESPTGEQYNIYNPKPFATLLDICMQRTAKADATVQTCDSTIRDIKYRGENPTNKDLKEAIEKVEKKVDTLSSLEKKRFRITRLQTERIIKELHLENMEVGESTDNTPTELGDIDKQMFEEAYGLYRWSGTNRNSAAESVFAEHGRESKYGSLASFKTMFYRFVEKAGEIPRLDI